MNREGSASWDELSCWLCDYAWFLIVFMFILLAGWYARDYWLLTGSPVTTTPFPPTPTDLPITSPPIPTHTRVPVTPTMVPLPSQIFTPTPALPQYIVVVVPLNWKGDRESFEAKAQREISYFYTESSFNNYFQLTVKLLADNMDTDLSSDTLLADIVEFGAERAPGDRYIGLTDGDISSNGDYNVTGWTTGPNSLGVVGEAGADYVIAHELGHTYGLCDEYNFAVWTEENLEFPNGCPNPFPTACEKLEITGAYCPGAPTSDGRNSIMGPSGLGGAYGFNMPSLEHLKKIFAEMALLN